MTIKGRFEKMREGYSEQAKVQVQALVSDYREVWAKLTAGEQSNYIDPDTVYDGILGNVAKTGRLRFVKGRRPMDDTNAYLWRLFYDHEKPGGCYLPIDSIMMARWHYGAELCERWERTVRALKTIATYNANNPK